MGHGKGGGGGGGGVSVGTVSVVLDAVVVGSLARTRVSRRFLDLLKAIFERFGNISFSGSSFSITFHRLCIDFFRVGNQGWYGITSVNGGSFVLSGMVGFSASGILLINSVRFLKGNVWCISSISGEG